MVDLAIPIRTALIGDSTITNELSAYAGSFPVFTRRPVPKGAKHPILVVSPDIVFGDTDGINDSRPVIMRDVAVYGLNNKAILYQQVETIARAVRTLFHRKAAVLTVVGWNVIDIVTAGPLSSPTDDEQITGRVVSLTVRLSKS